MAGTIRFLGCEMDVRLTGGPSNRSLGLERVTEIPRRARVSLDWNIVEIETALPEETDAPERAEGPVSNDANLLKAIKRARLKVLNPKELRVFDAYVASGCRNGDGARKLGMNPGSYYRLMHRSIEKIREYLEVKKGYRNVS